MKQILTLFVLLLSMAGYSQRVEVFKTDADGSERLAPQESFELGGSITNPNVVVDESNVRQTIDGFGYTMTQGSAEAILSMNDAKQDQLLNELYHPNTGIYSAVVRISLGASDLSNSSYSYNENPGDTDMSEFSLDGPDKTYLIPILKKIVAINPEVKFLATPWTAPKWMKTNNWWIGGSLMPTSYDAYARYFVKYLEAMDAQGLTIWGITPQNEPENGFNEPSMLMTSNQQLDFINNHLGPQIAASGYSPKIIAFDHNCDNTAYPIEVLNNSSFVDGAAFHLYAGEISAMSTVHDATNKNVYFTEQFTTGGLEADFNADFGWHMENVYIGSLRNRSKMVLQWNVASYPNFFPRTPGGCSDCLGAFTIDQGDYTKNKPFYTLAHFSKVIRPGAQILSSTQQPGNIFHIAAKNTDGSRALVVFNNNSSAQDLRMRWGTKSISYTLQGRSAVSFSWSQDAPQPPTNLMANGGSNSINLVWDAVSNAGSYGVWRSTSSTGTFAPIATNLLSPSFLDEEVVAETTYFYRIVARNAQGPSGFSNTASASPGVFTQFIQNGEYTINSRVHRQNITSDGTVLNLSMADVDLSDQKQVWIFEHLGENVYRIQNKASGKFIGLKDNWCGRFGELQANFDSNNDNVFTKVSKGLDAHQYVFEIAFTNCSGTSENNPIKAWDLQDGSVDGQIQTYDVSYGNANQQFEIIPFLITATEESLDWSGEVSLFPSPSKNQVTLVSNLPNVQLSQVSILSLEGLVISKKQNVNSSRIDLDISHLSSGVYKVEVLSTGNVHRSVQKLIVLH